MIRLACALCISCSLIVICVPAIAEDQPTKQAAERAESLYANLAAFQLELRYHGPQDKPFYGLTLSVPGVRQAATNQFHPVVSIDQDQAKRIIAFLASDGILDQAYDPKIVKQGSPTTAGYTLTIKEQDVMWRAELGWDLAMLQRLDRLHNELAGNAAESMKQLIGRLSGYRKQWEQASR